MAGKKPEPRQVPSDDCIVTIDGELYNPHADEWVKVLLVGRVGDAAFYVKILSLTTAIMALEGDPDEQLKRNQLTDAHYDDVITFLTGRIIAWNWTDMFGEPLPQPHPDASVLKTLSVEELWYLVSVVQGRNLSLEKKDTPTSETSSSATASTPTAANNSASAPSPMPA